MASPGDLLGGAGVLLAVLTFLYGLVYGTIDDALKLTLVDRNPADATQDRERIRHVRWVARGTAAAAVVLGVVFAAPALRSCRHFLGGPSFRHYDPLKTALVVTEVFFFGLAAHAAWSARRLTRRHGVLSGKKPLR